ncbi:VirB4 family type IV secretion system protein [Culicoidibacter larvae]|uniref:TraG P-loop domain-containing protein n=1 Tax=Culicoidibacter larvae TaxID=2579976 RepID=A0A5R8Q7Q6_9FIRM|nr:hypothetical protein [Culicoidibacter larvae]TLG71161.1 hypothetical protein FEZ08_11445 [Culicoidibacter larvae]
MGRHRKKMKAIKKEKIVWQTDPDLYDYIWQTPIAPKAKYIDYGSWYSACIMIYDYPTEGDAQWFANFLFADGIFTFDIFTPKKLKELKKIKNTLHEMRSRLSARDTIERITAEERYQEIYATIREVALGNEAIISLLPRIYLTDNSLDGLEEQVRAVVEHLELKGFMASVFLNQARNNEIGLFLPATLGGLPYKKMEATPLMMSYHYSRTQLLDQYGYFFGKTFDKYPVVFNPFELTNKRLSYSGLILGDLGAGKSTTLKRLIWLNYIRGDYVRIISVNREFDNLTQHMGGINLEIGGSTALNPLYYHQYKDVPASSWTAKNIERVQSFLKIRLGDAISTEQLTEFSAVLFQLYGEDGPKEEIIFSTIINHLKQSIFHPDGTPIKDEKIYDRKFARIEGLIQLLSEFETGGSSIYFNRKSSFDIKSHQVVNINISAVLGTENYNAMLFTLMHYLDTELQEKGWPELQAYNEREKEIYEVSRYSIFMDEAHYYFNSKNDVAVDKLLPMVRIMRKYFSGLWLATHTIGDMLKNGQQSETLQQLFEILQYTFVMKQHANAREALRSAFKQALSEHQLQQIPQFEKGETFLIINGVGTYGMKVSVTPEDIAIFGGGA